MSCQRGGKVLVTIPAFNASSTIAMCVASVLMQTYREFRVVVIDDGSTDDTLSQLRRLKDDRLEVLSDGRNRGLVYRLNESIDMCRESYLARMDADDVMHPQRLERQIEYMDAHSDCQVLGSCAISTNAEYMPTGLRRVKCGSAITLGDVIKGSPFIHPSVMGRSEWFRSNRYDEGFRRAEDRELWVRAFQPGIYHNLSEALLFYREMDCFKLEAYRQSCRADRKILGGMLCDSRYGTQRVWLQVASWVKEYIYTLASMVNIQDSLVASRSDSLSVSENVDAVAVLARVNQFRSLLLGIGLQGEHA